MTGGTAEVHDLAGAYAVSALSDLERARFERHLSSCHACRAEADELVETAARLGAAVTAAPPPSLRAQVLAEVDVTRQVPPRLGTGTPAPRRSIGRFVPAAAAAVAVAVTLGAVGVLGPRERLDDRAVAALAAPDARTIELAGDGGVTGRVIASAVADTVVLAVDALPARDEVYVLWTVRDGRPVNERTLAGGTGAPEVVLLPAEGVAEVAVTLEPRADVDAPTGPFVARATLTPPP